MTILKTLVPNPHSNPLTHGALCSQRSPPPIKLLYLPLRGRRVEGNHQMNKKYTVAGSISPDILFSGITHREIFSES